MTYAFIAVVIVVVIDRILAFIDMKKLERMTQDVMDRLSTSDHSVVDFNIRINDLSRQLTGLQELTGENFRWALDKFDSIRKEVKEMGDIIQSDFENTDYRLTYLETPKKEKKEKKGGKRKK